MARSFSDIGSSIFGFFFERDDDSRAVNVGTTSASTGFTVARTNKDDGAVESSLTFTKEFEPNSWISLVSVTTSDAENPSLSVESSKLSDKNVSIASTIQDPTASLDVGYNAQDKYCLDLSLNADFTAQKLVEIDVGFAYDSLLDKNLLLGANYNINNEENQQSYNLGAEYQYNPSTSFAVKANNNLKEAQFGFMYARNERTSLFGKVSMEKGDDDKPSVDYSLGLKRTINDKSSIGVNVNKNNTLNVRYNGQIMSQTASEVSGFVAANFDLTDVEKRAKLQYGLSIS